MKVKTESGVLITFVSEGSSKILLFDKPVRAIELKKEEISKINSLLVSCFETESDVDMRHINPIPKKWRG